MWELGMTLGVGNDIIIFIIVDVLAHAYLWRLVLRSGAASGCGPTVLVLVCVWWWPGLRPRPPFLISVRPPFLVELSALRAPKDKTDTQFVDLYSVSCTGIECRVLIQYGMYLHLFPL